MGSIHRVPIVSQSLLDQGMHAIWPIDRQPSVEEPPQDKITQIHYHCLHDSSISLMGSTKHCVLSTYHEHKQTVPQIALLRASDF